MAFDAGSVSVRLGAVLEDEDKFREYDRRIAKAEAKKRVEAEFGAKVNEREWALVNRKLDEAEARTKKRDAFKATIGAEYDARTFSRAFSAFERDLKRMDVAADRPTRSVGGLSRGFSGLNGQLTQFATRIPLVKWGALAAGGTLAAGAVTALASALAPLAGLMGALGPLATALAQVKGTLALATGDLKEAVGGLNEELDAESAAFKRLSPEGQKFAVTLQGLKPAFRDIQQAAQRGLFPGLEEGIRKASANLPVFQRLVRGTAEALGDLAARAGRRLGSDEWGADIEKQGLRNELTIRRLGTAGLNLAEAFRHVTLAAGPLVNRLTEWVVGLTKGIAKSAEAARESGRLKDFFEDAGDTFFQVKRILLDLAVAFRNIGRATRSVFGNDLLRSIERGADALRAWTQSARGTKELERIFQGLRRATYAIAEAIGDVVSRYRELRREGESAGSALTTVFAEGLAKAAEKVAERIPQIVEAFVRGFINANAWGKLLIGGWLLSKFGGAAAFAAMGRRLGGMFGLSFGATAGATAATSTAGTLQASARGGRLHQAAKGAGAALGPAMAGALISPFYADLLKGISGVFDRLGDQVGGMAGRVLQGVKFVLPVVGSGLAGNELRKQLGELLGQLKTAAPSFRVAAGRLGETISRGFQGSFGRLGDIVRGAFAGVLRFLRGLPGRLADLGRAAGRGYLRTWRAALGVIDNVVVSAFGAVFRFLRRVPGQMGSLGEGIGSALVKGIKGAARGLPSFFEGVINGVIDVINTAIRAINQITPSARSLPGPLPDIPGIPDIPTIPRLRGGGLVPALVSPGELLVDPSGAASVVPGRRVAADNVFTYVREKTRVFTDHGQSLLARGASMAQALIHQAPHFQEGGTVDRVSRFVRHERHTEGPSRYERLVERFREGGWRKAVSDGGAPSRGIARALAPVAKRTLLQRFATGGLVERIRDGGVRLKGIESPPASVAGRTLLQRFATGGQVARVAKQAGFRGARQRTAVAVAGAESAWNEKARSATSDHGLWQINQPSHPQWFGSGSKSIYNMLHNARAAFSISSKGGDWNPWVTFKSGAYRGWLGRAREAVSQGGAGTAATATRTKLQFGRAKLPSRLASFIAGASAEASPLWDNDLMPDIVAATNATVRRVSQRGPKGRQGTGPGTKGSGRMQRVLGEANRIDRANLPYVYGGGHSQPAPAGGPFDCSSAVARVMQAAGFKNFPTGVSGDYMSRGRPGRGRNLSILSTPGHTYALLAGKAWGTSSGNPGGGPGWISGYTTRPGFVARHPTDLEAGVFRRGGVVGRAVQKMVGDGGAPYEGIGRSLAPAALSTLPILRKGGLVGRVRQAVSPARLAAGLQGFQRGGKVSQVGGYGVREWNALPDLRRMRLARRHAPDFPGKSEGWKLMEDGTVIAPRSFIRRGGMGGVRNRALNVMRQFWGSARSFFPNADAAMPDTGFVRRLRNAAAVHTWPTKAHPEGQVLIPNRLARELTTGGHRRLRRGPTSFRVLEALGTVLHEWAHVHQRGLRNRKEVEGGAEEFSHRVLPRVAKRMGLRGYTGQYDSYPAEQRWVTRHHNKNWILRGQFLGRGQTTPEEYARGEKVDRKRLGGVVGRGLPTFKRGGLLERVLTRLPVERGIASELRHSQEAKGSEFGSDAPRSLPQFQAGGLVRRVLRKVVGDGGAAFTGIGSGMAPVAGSILPTFQRGGLLRKAAQRLQVTYEPPPQVPVITATGLRHLTFPPEPPKRGVVSRVVQRLQRGGVLPMPREAVSDEGARFMGTGLRLAPAAQGTLPRLIQRFQRGGRVGGYDVEAWNRLPDVRRMKEARRFATWREGRGWVGNWPGRADGSIMLYDATIQAPAPKRFSPLAGIGRRGSLVGGGVQYIDRPGSSPTRSTILGTVTRLARAPIGQKVRPMLREFANLIDSLDEDTRLLLKTRVDLWRRELRRLRRGGVTRRERPQVRELRRDIVRTTEELRPGAAPSYRRLERIDRNIQRRIRRVERGGIENREERVVVRRLRGARDIVSLEMGRRVSQGVRVAERLGEGLETARTRLSQGLRRAGVDEGSSGGLALSEQVQRRELPVLERMRNILKRQLARATRMGDTAQVRAITDKIKEVGETITETATTIAETVRAKVAAAAQEAVDAAAGFSAGVQALFQGLEIKQKLEGRYEGGGQERADFILTRIIPALQNELVALTGERDTALAQGDTAKFNATNLAILEKGNEIASAQLQAQEEIAANTETTSALLDQANEKLRIALETVRVQRGAFNTLAGPGDIGQGYASAIDAAQGTNQQSPAGTGIGVRMNAQGQIVPTDPAAYRQWQQTNLEQQHQTVINQTVNTLHPGDPKVLTEIARASNAGNGYTGTRTSPRERHVL